MYKKRSKKGVLEDPEIPIWIHKWKTIIPYHKPIKGTNIIPCKVPLDSKFAHLFSKYENFYNLDGLLGSLEAKGKKVKMILDINKSTYYYNSNLFPKENKKILFEHNLKKASSKSTSSVTWKSHKFIDEESKYSSDIAYVKAPLATKQLSDESYDSLTAIYQELDKYVLLSEERDEEEDPEFDHYILVH